MIGTILLYLFGATIAYRLYQLAIQYQSYRYLKTQGVVFASGGFYLLSDLMALEKIIRENPTLVDWGGMLKK